MSQVSPGSAPHQVHQVTGSRNDLADEVAEPSMSRPDEAPKHAKNDNNADSIRPTHAIRPAHPPLPRRSDKRSQRLRRAPSARIARQDPIPWYHLRGCLPFRSRSRSLSISCSGCGAIICMVELLSRLCFGVDPHQATVGHFVGQCVAPNSYIRRAQVAARSNCFIDRIAKWSRSISIDGHPMLRKKRLAFAGRLTIASEQVYASATTEASICPRSSREPSPPEVQCVVLSVLSSRNSRPVRLSRRQLIHSRSAMPTMMARSRRSWISMFSRLARTNLTTNAR